MKKFKRMLSAAVAAAMLVSALPALADEDKITAEEAIAAVRAVISIPDELSEFSYNDYVNGYGLNWYTPDNSQGINVSVNADGVITEFGSYNGEDVSGLSPFTKAELWQKAKDFLNRVVPALSEKLVLNEEDSNSRVARFNRYENGVEVEGNGAYIYFNRITGEVTSYDLSWDFDSDFPTEAPVTAEQALPKLTADTLKLQYTTFWPETVNAEETPKSVAYPVFVNSSFVRVNALTGETFERSYYREGSLMFDTESAVDEDMKASASDSGNGGGGYRLSRQELSALENMNNLISKDEIAAKIKAMPELDLPAEYKLSVNYLSEAGTDKTRYTAEAACIWDDEDEGFGRLTFDAESGKLTQVNISYPEMYSKPDAPVASETCDAVAESFLARTGDLSEYTEADERLNDSDAFFYKTYQRSIGGIPYPDDYKVAEVSKRTGKVIYYYEYVPDAEIQTPASTVTAEAAAAANFTVTKLYSYNDENKPVLCYALTPNADFAYVRAEDGRPVLYGGEPAVEKGEKADEPDHWAWKVFDILRQNDIYIEGNYSLNDQISNADFIDLIRGVPNVFDMPVRYYAFFDGGGADADKATNIDVPSREGAAELVMKTLGWDKLIALDIYSTEFADKDSFVGGLGGAAVLKGLGIMADENGYFYPRRLLTYGEAYSIAYNLSLLTRADADEPVPLK